MRYDIIEIAPNIHVKSEELLSLDQMVRHVFIIGAKGITGYGGFETFVRKLVEYSCAQGATIHYHISCKANGYGFSDERLIPGAKRIDKKNFTYLNAKCHKISTPPIGSAQAVLYDLASLLWALRESKRQNIQQPVFFLLSCRLGIAIDVLNCVILKRHGHFFLNPDGREWQREKWNRLIKAYFKFSEKRMVLLAERVICDSNNIGQFIIKQYPSAEGKTSVIPYGAEVLPEQDSDHRRAMMWLEQHNLVCNEYYLMVSRLIPENSYETIISEFMKSHTGRKLVMITTPNRRFSVKLEKKLHFRGDQRILFLESVYDEKLLMSIRGLAYACIHGHTAGGTNPSLLEAMAGNGFCLVRDVKYNNEVAEDNALYWTADKGCLSHLIDEADRMSSDEIYALRERAKARIRKCYSWNQIADRYTTLFMGRGTDCAITKKQTDQSMDTNIGEKVEA